MIVTKKLGDLCNIITGGTPPKSEKRFFNGDILWAKPDSLGSEMYVVETTEHLSEEGVEYVRAIPAGSIMISCIGIIGKASIASVKMATNQQINSLVIKDTATVDSEYLYYLICSCQSKIQGAALTSLVPIVNKTKLAGICIDYENDIDIQRRLVLTTKKRLAAIDAMAEKTTQQIADAECYIEQKIQERLVEPQDDRWKSGLIEDYAMINPTVRDISRKPDEEELVSFVPMPAVSAEEGRIIEQIVKPYSEVRKGYTYFEEGDILFAKITPCMQNGKIAIARNLENGIGFGSTEFHVIRSNDAIIPEWLYYLFRRKTYLAQAAEKMQGAVGQQRLPEEVIRNTPVAFPDSTDEQREIIAALESEIAIARKLIRDLRKQQENLSALRACIFREAFGNEE